MRSDRNGSCDANSRLRAFNVCYRPACPEGGFGVGVGAAAQEQTAGMGLVRRFSRPLTYFFGLCPVVLHGGALLFTAFSRRRVGLRGAQETIRDPAREANFRLSGNRVLKTAFVLRDSALAPSRSSSGPSHRALVRTHQGSMHLRCHLRLRFRSVGIPP